ncbi:MAG: ABC transporter permease, partial [Azospirillaceae bacterium]
MTIGALDRKLLRDLRGMAGQALAVALVVAAGVALYVMSVGTLRSLDETRAAYYERYRFADIFAGATRAPERVHGDIAAIEGVGAVATRVVADAVLRVPGLVEPARARLVSLPETGDARINDIVLRAGRMPRPGHPGEVLAHEAFVEAHGYALGARVEAVIDGRLRDLTIVGVALSPEFVYAIAPGELVPDDRRFGVFWMERPALEAALDMEGAFNDVAIGLLRGADPDPVIDAVDRLLDPYGGPGAVTRRDQPSHRILDSEFEQLANMGRTLPPIFLGVAAFLLHVVVGRTIELDRERIGLLKAFGYSDRAVAGHYLKLVLAITGLGILAGFAAGIQLGRGLTGLYTDFFRFPFLIYRLHADVFAAAGLVAAAAGSLGALSAVRRAAALAPA